MPMGFHTYMQHAAAVGDGADHALALGGEQSGALEAREGLHGGRLGGGQSG